MAVFISYSSQDRSSLEALHTALKRAQQQVWFDQELGGGDAWWNAILEQIRSCEVFIVALSNNWLQSKPSQAELRYAQALNRPILPVRVGPVDSMRVNPVATLQIIDYQNPTVDAGIQLVTAIHGLRAKAEPLPSPLPDEPPVPFGYITRLGNDLAEKELSPQQQSQLLLELRSGFDEDGDDPSARSDIAQLLRMLRLRHDVTYRTRTEIDNVLKEIEARDAGAAGKPAAPAASASDARTQAAIPVAAAASAQPTPATSPRPPAGQPVTAPPSQGGKSNKRLLILGGVAVAVILAIVLVVVFTSQGDKKKPAAKPSGATTAAEAPGVPGQTPTRAGPALLGAEELGTLVGDPNLGPDGKGEQLRDLKGKTSIPECLGSFEVLEGAIYRPHGATGGHWESYKTKDGDTHRIVEATATFPSAEKARAFVEESANKWRTCANQAVTYTSGGKPAEWNVADVVGEAANIAQLRTQASGRACQHALHAVTDLVIEVQSCGPEGNDAAVRIADEIATRAAK